MGRRTGLRTLLALVAVVSGGATLWLGPWGLLPGVLIAVAVGAWATRSIHAAASADAEGARWLGEADRLRTAIQRERDEAAADREELERERRELALLIAAVSEGILQLDDAGHVLRANPAARRLLALPDDFEGRPIDVVVRGPELRMALHEAVAGGGLGPREASFEERTLVVSAQPIPNGGDPAGGVAIAIADLTAVRRLESVRRDFVANASHELKTPLTSIRGYAETLLGEELPESMRRQFLETIFSNADRLQRIIDDLLDLSRLESGRWQPQLVEVDAAEIARGAWQDYERRAREGRVAFDVKAEGSGRVVADPSALRQILSNLYDNALRYTPEGGSITATIAPAAAGGRAGRAVVVEVRDTGAGIPGNALPRIFERFYRVDPARSRAEGGTGLGLSIVKHLAESMGGRVDADSRLGRGTAIRLTLPAPAPQPPSP